MAKTILIVDEDRDTLDRLSAAFEDAGYQTRTASTGNEAIRQARSSRPDLVLMDLVLPGLNGFSVCETLREEQATANTPIIIQTSLPGEFPRMAGIEAGADVYLNKPIETSDLMDHAEELLRRPRGAGAPRHSTLAQRQAA